MDYVFTAALWVGYCALHSYLISVGFTNLMVRLSGKFYVFFRLFYVLVSLALLIPLIRYTDQTETRTIIAYEYPWTIVRTVLLVGSLAMFFHAFFFSYDALSFFGIRQILNYKKEKRALPATAIRKNGLLGVLRHPMYFALIIYLWCQTFTVMNVVVNAILTIYVIIGTKLEEKKLVLELGNPYIEYQREVPMIVPFTKPRQV